MFKSKFICLAATLFFALFTILTNATQGINLSPKIVVIIPSYNNERWCTKNIDSVFHQKYGNFRIIYINDKSSDKTGQLAKEYIHAHDAENKICYIENQERRGALCNLYNAIHSCSDEEIIATVDGDDWLAHENVLSIIGNTYKDPNVWLTYGQFFLTYGAVGHCRQYPNEIIQKRSYRSVPWYASHLRTFRAFLFKAIKKEDLMFEGKFFEMTWDLAFMFPMLEMAGPQFKFIPDILYIYNRDNPISDDKVNLAKQEYLDRIIRNRPTYPLFEDLTKANQ